MVELPSPESSRPKTWMFGIFFVDSLGFLRIVDTPILIDGAWQAADNVPRLAIGIMHVVAAVIAVLTAFGVGLSEEQVSAIIELAAVFGPLVTAFLIRRISVIWLPT